MICQRGLTHYSPAGCTQKSVSSIRVRFAESHVSAALFPPSKNVSTWPSLRPREVGRSKNYPTIPFPLHYVEQEISINDTRAGSRFGNGRQAGYFPKLRRASRGPNISCAASPL